MWTVKHNHSDVMCVNRTFFLLSLSKHLELSICSFWIIALPVMAIVLPLFLWSDLKRVWHYLQKRMAKRSVKQVCSGICALSHSYLTHVTEIQGDMKDLGHVARLVVYEVNVP